MKFVIIHFNTPELTACLCSSIKKFHSDANIVIFDNSDRLPFKNKDILCNSYIDNTNNTIINFDNEFKTLPIVESVWNLNKCGSAKHCRTIQWLFDNLEDDEFVLLDSDVLLIKQLDFFNSKFSCAATYEVFPNMKHRFLPFVTYFNLKLLREKHIHYFDVKRMNGLSIEGEQYDTGASFLEDVINNNLPFLNINFNNYLVHFKNGSWSTKSYQQWLINFKQYWLY